MIKFIKKYFLYLKRKSSIQEWYRMERSIIKQKYRNKLEFLDLLEYYKEYEIVYRKELNELDNAKRIYKLNLEQYKLSLYN